VSVPIRPENRARYPKNWPEISRRIRFDRAKGKCEQCGAPHGQVIFRSACGAFYMLDNGATYHADDGTFLGWKKASELPAGRFVRVILTTAHLDHTPENCADENLKALCQLHHLRLDKDLHAASTRRTVRAKKASGDLFEVA
jgi:ribosomal protein S14